MENLSGRVEAIYAKVDPENIKINSVRKKTVSKSGKCGSSYIIKYSYHSETVLEIHLQEEWDEKDKCFVFYQADWQCYSVYMEQAIARAVAWDEDYEEHMKEEAIARAAVWNKDYEEYCEEIDKEKEK